jgi:hypothetical protein
LSLGFNTNFATNALKNKARMGQAEAFLGLLLGIVAIASMGFVTGEKFHQTAINKKKPCQTTD